MPGQVSQNVRHVGPRPQNPLRGVQPLSQAIDPNSRGGRQKRKGNVDIETAEFA